jgi:hypothetical protein
MKKSYKIFLIYIMMFTTILQNLKLKFNLRMENTDANSPL